MIVLVGVILSFVTTTDFNCTLEGCSGHGNCTDNECQCFLHYYGEQCSVTTCNSIFSNSSAVCNFRNGTCTEYNSCQCNIGYSPPYCSPTCRGLANDTGCSNHGACVSLDKCVCYEGYCSQFCDLPMCGGYCSDDKEVCHGHGWCTDVNICDCYTGYDVPYKDCSSWECFGIVHNSSSVCSGNGYCYKPDKCTCFDLYFGVHCTEKEDDRTSSNNPAVAIAISVSCVVSFCVCVVCSCLIVACCVFVGLHLQSQFGKGGKIDYLQFENYGGDDEEEMSFVERRKRKRTRLLTSEHASDDIMED